MAKLLPFLLFLLPSLGMALTSATSLTTEVEEEVRFLPENLLVEFEQEFGSDFQESATQQTNLDSTTSIALTWELAKKRKLSVSGYFKKNVNSPAEGSLSNIKLKLSSDYTKTNVTGVKYRNGVALYTPTSEQDREDTSFNTAIAYQPRMIISWEDRGIPNELWIDPGLRQNFHDFTTNNQGEYNVEYSADLLLRNFYELNDTFTFKLQGSYGLKRTYNGINKESFGLEEEIMISLPSNFTLGIGHNNGGDVLRADGSSNFNIYDDIGSTFYTYLYYKM